MGNHKRGTARFKPANASEFTTGQQKNAETRAHNQSGAVASAEIANYIAQLTAEMGNMAVEARLANLAQFLAMARLEAEMISRQPPS